MLLLPPKLTPFLPPSLPQSLTRTQSQGHIHSAFISLIYQLFQPLFNSFSFPHFYHSVCTSLSCLLPHSPFISLTHSLTLARSLTPLHSLTPIVPLLTCFFSLSQSLYLHLLPSTHTRSLCPLLAPSRVKTRTHWTEKDK